MKKARLRGRENAVSITSKAVSKFKIRCFIQRHQRTGVLYQYGYEYIFRDKWEENLS
jgi:hypothetical protein